MKKISAVLVSCLLLLSVISVQASDFVKSVTLAKDYYLTGFPEKAAIEIKQSLDLLWPELPLIVYNTKLIEDLNSFVERSDNSFNSGEPMYITWQTMGYGFGKTGGGYSIEIALDSQVTSMDGTVLSTKKNVQQFKRMDPARSTEFYTYLTYKVSGGTPGNYILQITLRDLNSTKTTSFDIPFILK